MDRVDVFPSDISNTFSKLPEQFDFRKLIETTAIIPFTFCLDAVSSKIFYHVLPINVFLYKHLVNIGRTLAPSVDLPHRLSNWSVVEGRLLIPITEARRNVDRRTSYKFDNIFVVKPAFTSGQRTVQEGTVHLIQIHKAAIKLHFVPEAKLLRIRRETRRFNASEQVLYSSRTLHPFKNYVVPEGTIYILHTLQNSIFSIDVLSKTTEIDLCTSPFVISPPSSPVEKLRAEAVVIGSREEGNDGLFTSGDCGSVARKTSVGVLFTPSPDYTMSSLPAPKRLKKSPPAPVAMMHSPPAPRESARSPPAVPSSTVPDDLRPHHAMMPSVVPRESARSPPAVPSSTVPDDFRPHRAMIHSPPASAAMIHSPPVPAAREWPRSPPAAPSSTVPDDLRPHPIVLQCSAVSSSYCSPMLILLLQFSSLQMCLMDSAASLPTITAGHK